MSEAVPRAGYSAAPARRRGWIRLAAATVGVASVLAPLRPASAAVERDWAFVATQLTVKESHGSHRVAVAGGMLPAEYGDGARIILVPPDGQPRVLTDGFHSAADPSVSFDGRRLLFAGKRNVDDRWSIYELDLDGGQPRQITNLAGNARNPNYQGRLYTINSSEPWDQITFVGDLAGELNEYGPVPSTSLYSVRPDGSELQRLTYNPSSDLFPTLLPDGRLLFSVWQRRSLDRGLPGRIALFAAQLDGFDYALFSGDEGARVKLMPCVTTDRQVVFVEGDRVAWDGSGTLAAVSLRRNLHSHRMLTDPEDGLFHSPSPLPDDRVLVSRRPADGGGTHGIHVLDPADGTIEPVFDDPDRHDIQAKIVAPRPRPDGRSSSGSTDKPTGRLYCLDVAESDLVVGDFPPPDTGRRLRVLEAIPRTSANSEFGKTGFGSGSTEDVRPPLLRRRFLGEVPIEEDGSFNIEVPANLPIELQLLDEDGAALASCGWIWVRNGETRGCIGCHEDAERTPPNRFVRAVAKPSIDLVLPPSSRRTVDFQRDVEPILAARCASPTCHGASGVAPLLTGRGSERSDPSAPFSMAYRNLLVMPRLSDSASFVDPGRARTSPLVWHVLGKRIARPWDHDVPDVAVVPMPPQGSAQLSVAERRTLIEWIDLGAMWNGGPTVDVEGSPAGGGGVRP